MPRLKRTELPTGFTSLADVRKQHNEVRDCTVVALTLVTGLPYSECHKAMADAGRKPRCAAYIDQWRSALEALGFKLIQWPSDKMQAMIDSYPAPPS